jgi:O-antigen/teichoic acid export membrane protein
VTSQSASNRKDWLWQVFRVYTPQILRLVSAFFLTGWLSPFLTGQFALVWMVLSFFAIPADGGVKRLAMAAGTFSVPDAQQWTRANRTRAFTWAVLTLIAGLLFSYVLLSLFALTITLFSSAYTFLYGYTAPAFALEQRDGKFDALARRDVSSSLISLALAWAAALSGNPGLALLCMFSLPPLMVCLWMLIENPPALRPVFVKDAPAASWTSIGSDVLHAAVLRVDSLAVGFFAGQTTLGLYNRANGLVHQPIAFLQAVSNPVVERLLLMNDTHSSREFARIASGFFLFAGFGWMLSATATVWIPIVWSEAWLSTAAFMPPMLLAGCGHWLQVASDPVLVNRAAHITRFRLKLSSFMATVLFAVLLPFAGTMLSLWIFTSALFVSGFVTVAVLFSKKEVYTFLTFSGGFLLVFVITSHFLSHHGVATALQCGYALAIALYYVRTFFK